MLFNHLIFPSVLYTKIFFTPDIIYTAIPVTNPANIFENTDEKNDAVSCKWHDIISVPTAKSNKTITVRKCGIFTMANTYPNISLMVLLIFLIIIHLINECCCVWRIFATVNFQLFKRNLLCLDNLQNLFMILIWNRWSPIYAWYLEQHG